MSYDLVEKTNKNWITGNTNACPHSVTCKCLTNGKPKPVIRTFNDHSLAGGGIPECCVEIRHILHPKMTEAELIALYQESRT